MNRFSTAQAFPFRYIQRGNAVVLHPFNPDYEDLIIRGEELDHLYIAGKVVETKAKW